MVLKDKSNKSSKVQVGILTLPFSFSFSFLKQTNLFPFPLANIYLSNLWSAMEGSIRYIHRAIIRTSSFTKKLSMALPSFMDRFQTLSLDL